MDLRDISVRTAPVPWDRGERLPWNDPDFSARMLREHLSQDHDLASRRASVIDEHAAWIDRHLLRREPAAVLDLACGPGLYVARLGRLGHRAVGIDFAPASIAYARERTRESGDSCLYHLADLRDGFTGSFRLVLLTYGELNTFRPGDAASILANAFACLEPDGLLVLEVHTENAVREIGARAPTWSAAARGLFSERPHLCLKESFWIEDEAAAVERYHVIDADTAQVARYGCTTRAYDEDEYLAILAEAGFDDVTRYPSLAGRPMAGAEGLFVLVARKAG